MMKNRSLQAGFIDMSIKQTVYERNFQFIKQVNMQKLESRANSLYVELVRLNVGNAEMIGKFYQENLGRRDKFNYDQRGLYVEGEVVAKRENLQRELVEFERKEVPCKRLSSQDELKSHIAEFITYSQRRQELNELSKSVKVSNPISQWLPLRLQHSNSINEPLKL